MKALLLVLFLLTACASRPPDMNRKIVTEVEIKRMGAFLSENPEPTDIKETFPLSLMQQNVVGFTEPDERVLAAESEAPSEREAFVIVPEPAPGKALRFFLYRGQKSIGAVRLDEKAGATAQTSAGLYSIRLTIKGVESP